MPKSRIGTLRQVKVSSLQYRCLNLMLGIARGYSITGLDLRVNVSTKDLIPTKQMLSANVGSIAMTPV